MADNPHLAKDLRRILIDEETIAKRVQELADEINEKYKDSEEPLILVGVLKGSFIFLADLSRRLTIPHIVDFIAISSYGKKGDKRGEVRLLMDTRENLAGHDVLIVEDILDSGSTLSYLIRTFGARSTKSVSTAVFLDKPALLNQYSEGYFYSLRAFIKRQGYILREGVFDALIIDPEIVIESEEKQLQGNDNICVSSREFPHLLDDIVRGEEVLGELYPPETFSSPVLLGCLRLLHIAECHLFNSPYQAIRGLWCIASLSCIRI